MKKVALNIIFLLVLSNLFAQNNNLLESYIEEGLNNNLSLQQKQYSYEKSMLALKEARALFLPDLSLNARYSVANGGRTIDFPVGDMLNPVYSTLNQMTTQMYAYGLTEEIFPATVLENEEIEFLRPHEQETKLQLIQPIFNPQVYYNYKIKKDLTGISRIDIDIYKRELIAEIQNAYYNFIKTEKFLKIIDETLILANENLRVNEKLFENDKITIDNVYKAQSEISKLEQQKAEIIKNNKASKAYFNFILNKPLESEIQYNEELFIPVANELEQSRSIALENREEFEKLSTYAEISTKQINMNKYNRLPTITGAVDYGFQGEEYDFNDDADFILASIVLKWNLFKGFQNNIKIQENKIDKYIIESKQEELKSQIQLQVINSHYEIEAALQSVKFAEAQEKSATKAFEIVSKKYSEGQAGMLEYIDARTSMTNAKMNTVISKYDLRIKYVELEKITANYQLNKTE